MREIKFRAWEGERLREVNSIRCLLEIDIYIKGGMGR